MNKDIKESQIYYSPLPRNSLNAMSSSLMKTSQMKNVASSKIANANVLQDGQVIEKQFTEKNPILQMSVTERVVTEAILDLNFALRAHHSSLNQQSLVNNNSSFIQMNENEKNILRKNRIQYQVEGLLVQQYYKKEDIFIPILPVRSSNSPYMLEIKDVFDGKRFTEEQEVFFAFDHLTNYYFNMKIYIVEKGSDDAILFSIDNVNSIFEGNEEQSNSDQKVQIKAFCLENIEKDQYILIFLQQSKYNYHSHSSSDESSDQEDNQQSEKKEQKNKMQTSEQTSDKKPKTQNESDENQNKQFSSTKKNKRANNMNYSRKQDEKVQRTVKKYVKIARAYSFLGQPEMAINFYNRIFNNQNINKFNVSEVDALEELMFFLEEMEKESEAIKKADRLLEIFTKIGNVDKIKQILFFKGNLSIKVGDFGAAEKDYRKLLEYLQMEEGEEISYLAGITYGKLADIQFILENNDKCLELLNEKYNTLIEIYKNQALPEIQELNDEEEYQQFNENNKESHENSFEKQNQENKKKSIQIEYVDDIHNQNESDQSSSDKKSKNNEEKLNGNDINLNNIKDDEEEDDDFEYLNINQQRATLSDKKQNNSREGENSEDKETQDVDEQEQKQNISFDSDLQSEDIRQIAAKSRNKQMKRSFTNQQAEQSPMLRNSFQSKKRKDFNFSSHCQSSIMRSEILRFDQKILKELWNCSQSIAEVYFQFEDIDFSLNYYCKSLEFAEKLFGKESLQVAQMYESIGLVRLQNMDFDESQEYFQKSMQIKQKICCDDHPQLAFSYSYLGCLYAKFHMYKQAKEYYLKALTILQYKYKENKKELSETYNNIANIYLNEAEIDLAISSYEKALELFFQLKGEIPPFHFAQIYENLGIAYYQCGKYQQSLPFFQESEAILVSLYDEQHPILVRARNWKKTTLDRIDIPDQYPQTSQ